MSFQMIPCPYIRIRNGESDRFQVFTSWGPGARLGCATLLRCGAEFKFLKIQMFLDFYPIDMKPVT